MVANWKLVVLYLGLTTAAVTCVVNPNSPMEARASCVTIIMVIASCLPKWLGAKMPSDLTSASNPVAKPEEPGK